MQGKGKEDQRVTEGEKDEAREERRGRKSRGWQEV